MIVLPIVTSLIGVGQSYLSNLVGQRVMNDLRVALYSHLQWMPLRFFTETRTGEIQSRISNDVGGVQSVVTDTASSLLSNTATVASTVIAMVILDWRLTALSLGMLPIFAYITFRVGKVRREVSRLTQQSMAEMSAITEESLSVAGILLSKTFGQQSASIDRFERESSQDGFIQRMIDGQQIRFRVSIMPIVGVDIKHKFESIVIRVLDNRKVPVAGIAKALDLRLDGNGKIHCWHPERHKHGDRTASVGIRGYSR